jgi:site-specific DNA-methyltransferase (adenine-specific)
VDGVEGAGGDMSEVWTSGDVTLYRGDCLEIMPTLANGSVDAVVTDPPYGIGFAYASHDDTPEGYGAWLWSVIELAESKCSPGSPVFVWQAMLNVRHLTEWFPREWRLFAACKNFVQMRKVAMQYAYDPVVVWWTDGERYSDGTLSRDWHVGNTANTLNRGAGEAGGHPCARPLDQLAHIINQWVKPGATVLDPFMGSGTTGVACVQTGRKFIGIEIDEGYFEIAKRRIIEAQMQPTLEGI